MGYTRQTWYPLAPGGTKITATRLNHMEEGIEAAAATADTAITRLDALTTDSLSDVDTTTTPPVDGQPLVFSAAEDKFIPGTASIDSLSDVDIAGVADGDTLVFDESVGKFLPGNGGGVSVLDDLTDVDTTTTAPIAGDMLIHDGDKWVVFTPATPGIVPPQVYRWTIRGALAVETGKLRYVNETGHDLTITSVRMEIGTAPGSGNVIVDIHKGGTTIFTTQSRRPTGLTSDVATDPNVTVWEAGAFLTMDVDDIGTGTPPVDLVVTVLAIQ
ncbi:hypothetical protein [Agromyces sp. NPDC058104]|uniref:hypothetical protein n=1 Tax=Agromyces sp. NPDC058104 TaxID=3346342 RepID=UPI0036D99497